MIATVTIHTMDTWLAELKAAAAVGGFVVRVADRKQHDRSYFCADLIIAKAGQVHRMKYELSITNDPKGIAKVLIDDWLHAGVAVMP